MEKKQQQQQKATEKKAFFISCKKVCQKVFQEFFFSSFLLFYRDSQDLRKTAFLDMFKQLFGDHQIKENTVGNP